MSTSHISDNDLVFRIFRKLVQLNNKKTKKKPINQKNGQSSWADISPKKIYKWPIAQEKINIMNH